MAYTTDDYRFSVTGVLGSFEVFSNTWTVTDIGGTNPVVDCVPALRGFYQAIDDWLSADMSIDACQVRNLGTNVVTDFTWASIPGLNTQALLPTQLAVRVSLRSALAQNGGPFIVGWAKQASTDQGLVLPDVVDDLLAAVVAMDNALEAQGYNLAIDRPTGPEVVDASQVRIGSRFDVIRKRANQVMENYVTASLT